MGAVPGRRQPGHGRGVERAERTARRYAAPSLNFRGGAERPGAVAAAPLDPASSLRGHWAGDCDRGCGLGKGEIMAMGGLRSWLGGALVSAGAVCLGAMNASATTSCFQVGSYSAWTTVGDGMTWIETEGPDL